MLSQRIKMECLHVVKRQKFIVDLAITVQPFSQCFPFISIFFSFLKRRLYELIPSLARSTIILSIYKVLPLSLILDQHSVEITPVNLKPTTNLPSPRTQTHLVSAVLPSFPSLHLKISYAQLLTLDPVFQHFLAHSSSERKLLLLPRQPPKKKIRQVPE